MTQRDKLIELLNTDMSGCNGDYAEEMADYLLHNGVIVPPCKVGDTVYQTDGVRIYESKIDDVIYLTAGIAFDESAIGDSIYLTREEAEKALKERGKQ